MVDACSPSEAVCVECHDAGLMLFDTSFFFFFFFGWTDFKLHLRYPFKKKITIANKIK